MSMRPGMRVDEKEDGDEDIWHILSFCVCGGVGNTEQKNIQWQHPKQKTKKQFTFILQYAITQNWLYFHLKNRSDDLYILNSVCVFFVFSLSPQHLPCLDPICRIRVNVVLRCYVNGEDEQKLVLTGRFTLIQLCAKLWKNCLFFAAALFMSKQIMGKRDEHDM